MQSAPAARALRLRAVFELLVALLKLPRRQMMDPKTLWASRFLLSALVRYTSTSDGAASRDDFELIN